jgi:hypothetical protein
LFVDKEVLVILGFGFWLGLGFMGFNGLFGFWS